MRGAGKLLETKAGENELRRICYYCVDLLICLKMEVCLCIDEMGHRRDGD